MDNCLSKFENCIDISAIMEYASKEDKKTWEELWQFLNQGFLIIQNVMWLVSQSIVNFVNSIGVHYEVSQRLSK